MAIAVSFAPRSLDAFTGTLFVATDDPATTATWPSCASRVRRRTPPQLLAPARLRPDPGRVFRDRADDLHQHRRRHPVSSRDRTRDRPKRPRHRQSGLRRGSAVARRRTARRRQQHLSDLPARSVGIGVSFQPDDAGSVVWADSASPATTSTISMPARSPAGRGASCLQPVRARGTQPRQLPFGEVPPGNTGQLQLDVRNVGKAFCVLTKLALDPSSDAAFSLPAGRLDHAVLSYATNTYNPTSLPTSLVVDVEFAPTASEPGATGTVEIDAFDLASPIEVALSGSKRGGLPSRPAAQLRFRGGGARTPRAPSAPLTASPSRPRIYALSTSPSCSSRSFRDLPRSPSSRSRARCSCR